ncbi:protein CUSTOS [Varanus komodoensis]|uniref:protein CUSTOS n=1 Tax=Varanus komodoensis TaxID=61221 RepID=UPI001CF7D1F2|nr:protein CUSTOS [Varanus komodoensis]
MAEGGGSSSEDEAAAASALARLREATWEPARSRSPPAGIFKKRKFPSAEPSIREWISDQGQDGNELQTTPSFRAHVAKKLAAILDSSISPVEPPPWPGPSDVTVSETEDDGFRLFSSSVPGDCGTPEALPPGRRRLQRSSSSELDSDQEWQRCREAAVMAADILRQGGLLMPLQDCSQSCQAAVPPGKKTVPEAQRTRDKEQEAVGTAQNGRAAAKTEGSSCLGVMAKKKKKKKQKKVHTE